MTRLYFEPPYLQGRGARWTRVGVIHEHSDNFILGQDFAIQTVWLYTVSCAICF